MATVMHTVCQCREGARSRQSLLADFVFLKSAEESSDYRFDAWLQVANFGHGEERGQCSPADSMQLVIPCHEYGLAGASIEIRFFVSLASTSRIDFVKKSHILDVDLTRIDAHNRSVSVVHGLNDPDVLSTKHDIVVEFVPRIL